MRKVHQEMIAAIRARKSCIVGGNTQVSVEPGVTRVFLHGNHIATVRENGLDVTLAGWPTPTTRSRVNALIQEFIHANAGVYQKGGDQYCRSPANWAGWKIADTEWVTL